MRRSLRNRRGLGALIVLVLVLLLGLFTAALGRRVLTDRSQRDSAAGADGERCRLAVRSALDEAYYRFSLLANKSRGAVFDALRRGASFSGKLEVPVTSRLLSGGRASLDGGAVRFTFVPAMTQDGPYAQGRVTFFATVSAGWLSRCGRSGTAVREVRLAQVTPTSPFDQATLLILSPFNGLADPDRANRTIAEGEEESRRLRDERRRIDGLLEDLAAAVGDELGGYLNGRVDSLPRKTLPAHPRYSNDVHEKYHFLDRECVVACFQDVADLRSLAVGTGEEREMSDAVDRLRDPQERASRALEQDLRDLLAHADDRKAGAVSEDESKVAIDRLASRVESCREASLGYGWALVNRSLRYTRLTDSLVEYTGAKAREVRAAGRALFDVESAWKRRASLVMKDPAELEAFLARFRTRGEGLRGVAYVPDTNRPLSLDGMTLGGRMVLATPSPVTAAGETLGDPASLLTLVCGRFELTGTTAGSVVCKRFRGAQGGRIHGQLLIEELGSADDFAGAVGFDRRIESRKDKVQAVLSPWVVEGGVSRGAGR